jgi:hypothetical protein
MPQASTSEIPVNRPGRGRPVAAPPRGREALLAQTRRLLEVADPERVHAPASDRSRPAPARRGVRPLAVLACLFGLVLAGAPIALDVASGPTAGCGDRRAGWTANRPGVVGPLSRMRARAGTSARPTVRGCLAQAIARVRAGQYEQAGDSLREAGRLTWLALREAGRGVAAAASAAWDRVLVHTRELAPAPDGPRDPVRGSHPIGGRR